ncbi:MAG: AAA family ATPase [Acidimicrobiales bacterium]
MYLKTLTLKGFKSFAEKATLELEPGITVVVGPNGSGKSNVVDAVAWVLGAQGPSTVRSSKMEEVIFSGSGARPALGRAEVSLTIDNASGRLPIGLAEVTVSRTLWRSGESEYAINGAPCRLLDISEMLADSGVGRHQHVIVSQGQLEAVLSARPEERRLIIEEAAGILKYRRRRERADRRMAATAGDLARLEDLVREVRTQLRPLERQAQAARRHDALVAEAKAIRLYLAGRELADAQGVADATHGRLAEFSSQCVQMRARLSVLEEELSAAELVLADQRIEGHNASIGSLERLGERALGLAAVVSERRRSVARLLESMVDGSVVTALEAEVAKLEAALLDADVATQALALERSDLELEEARLAETVLAPGSERAGSERAGSERAGSERAGSERAGSERAGSERAGSGFAGSGFAGSEGSESREHSQARAGEMRGRLGALRSSLVRDSHELVRTKESMGTLDRRRAELSAAFASHNARVALAETASVASASGLAEAEMERTLAEQVAEAAGAAARSAEAETQRWETREEALEQALDHLRAGGGAAQLNGIPGLLGTLAELVEVEDGWEAAFEAAIGDASAAAVLVDVPGAVAALEQLVEREANGSVIAAWPGAQGGSAVPAGSLGERAEVAPGSVCQGALLAHVRAGDPAVQAILASLLRPLILVDGDWRAAIEVALEQPSLVVVTRSGHRFGPDGWRIGTPGLGATGAALSEARSRSAGLAGLSSRRRAERLTAEAELARTRRCESALRSERDANAERLSGVNSQMRQLKSELDRTSVEAESVRLRLQSLTDQVQDGATEISELEGELEEVERAEEAQAGRARRELADRRSLEGQAATLRVRYADLSRRCAGLDERKSMLGSRLAEVENRLSRLAEAREGAAERRKALELGELVAARLAGVIGSAQERLAAELERLRGERAVMIALNQERVVTTGRLRAEHAALLANLNESTEQLHEADLAYAEARFRLEAGRASLERDFEVSPKFAVAAACPELPAELSATQRSAQLERELRLAGPVNPLAEAELATLRERAQLLDSQLGDVVSARGELTTVMRAIDVEMSGVFGAAYQDVAGHFSNLFSTLFTGGEGSLTLTEPDNLLETGIEVVARPGGKKVRSISLLSGGERSLVALAFLFAVFRSRPAPFYLLDEVEAALDDVNLQRFLNLIHEFRSDAQLVIVSHQRRTMEAADCLYGVSMPAGGSSRVVSERAPSTA